MKISRSDIVSTSIVETRDVTASVANTNTSVHFVRKSTHSINVLDEAIVPSSQPTATKNSPLLTTSQEREPLPTPVQVDVLSSLLKGYHDFPYITNGFRQGFKLDFFGNNTPFMSHNSASVQMNPFEALSKISIELSLNRIAGPFERPPFDSFKVSPLALREKGDTGKFRLLHNLSYPYNDDSVNFNIPESCSKVKYESINDAVKILQNIPNAWMAKADIADAFRLIPLHPSDYNLTGFHLDGFYYDKCLPMGCSSSCKIFERFSTSLKWILKTQYNVCNIVKVLDDFLFIADTESECALYLKSFENLCSILNIPIATHKTEKPTKTLTFLGIELDSFHMIARLPKDKLIAYSDNVENLLFASSCSLKVIKSVTGQLQFATAVIKGGKPFLRRLYDSTIGFDRNDKLIVLSKDMKSDLKIWYEFLLFYNGVTLISRPLSVNSCDIHLYTDSSKHGYGGVYGKHFIKGSFPQAWQILDIQVSELYPIFLLVHIFAKNFANKMIIFHSDNISVVTALNKQSSRCKGVMRLLRPLVLKLLQHNISFTSLHIPGKLNVLIDLISRNQVTSQLLDYHQMDRLPTPIPLELLPQNLNLL